MKNKLHEKVYQLLKGCRKELPTFYYWFRQRDRPNKETGNSRFEEGTWFQGTDKYAFVGLYDRSGGVNMTRSVGLVFLEGERLSVYVEVVYKGEQDQSIITFYQELMERIGGFEPYGDSKYRKYFEGEDYEKSVKQFLVEEKPKIDELVRQKGLDHLFITKEKFEKAALKILDFRGEETNILQPFIEKYKKLLKNEIPSINYDEIYKWETIQYFQDNWKDDHTSETILENLNSAFNKSNNNLWSGSHFLPYKMILIFATEQPETVSKMFHQLFDESQPLENRMGYFLKASEDLVKSIYPDKDLAHYQGKRTMMLYLTLRYPDKYYLYKNGMYNDFCILTKFREKPGSSKKYSFEIIPQYMEDCDEVRSVLMADQELLDIHKSLIPKEITFQDDYHTLTQDFIYCVSNYFKKENPTAVKKKNPKYWLYAPGENAFLWEECIEKGIISMGWDGLGDLSQYKSKNEIVPKLQEIYQTTSSKKNDATANYEFSKVMSIGDIIIVKTGQRSLLGYGEVTSDYYFDEERSNYKSCRKVDWIKQGNWTTDFDLVLKTLTNITKYPTDNPHYDKYYERLLAIINGQYIKKKIKNQMNFPLNQILFGPPGTGKTYSTIDKVVEILEPELYQSNDHKTNKKEYEKLIKEGRIVFTTFHQSMTYEDFVEGIKPKKDENNQVYYEIEDGIFKRICQDAQTPNQTGFNEAFNQLRKDLSEVEMQPLKTPTGREFAISLNSNDNLTIHTGPNKEKQGSMIKEKIQRQLNGDEIFFGWRGYFEGVVEYLKTKYNYSLDLRKTDLKYALIIDEINRGNISQIFGELITLIEGDKRLGNDEALEISLPYSKDKFSVPPNLYIIGTMNTADRSVEALDTALRRRFSFIEMQPDPTLLEGIQLGGIDFPKLLKTINQRIEKLLNKDYMIGHAYFLGLKEAENKQALLRSIFADKILPLLQEYFYGSFGKIQLVLGKQFVKRANDNHVVFADADFDGGDYQEREIYTIINVADPAFDIIAAVINIYLPDEK